MLSQKALTSSRSNNHLSNNHIEEPLHLHVFGRLHHHKDQERLLDELDSKQCQYSYHLKLDELYSIRKNQQNKKHLVVLLSCVLGEDELKRELQNKIEGQSWRKVHIYTYPNYLPSLGINHLSQPRNVMDTFEELKKGSTKKAIRLSGVHSIDKKHSSSSKDITRINTTHVYQQVRYFQPSTYSNSQDALYETVVETLRTKGEFVSFSDIEATIGKSKRKDKGKKILIVAPSDVGDHLVKVIVKESKERVFDVMLIGPLSPHTYYLAENVMLATNQPQKVEFFFLHRGILSSKEINQMRHSGNIDQVVTTNAEGYTTRISQRVQHNQDVIQGTNQIDNIQVSRGEVLQSPKMVEPLFDSSADDYGISSASKGEGSKRKAKKLKPSSVSLIKETVEVQDQTNVLVNVPTTQNFQSTPNVNSREVNLKRSESDYSKTNPNIRMAHQNVSQIYQGYSTAHQLHSQEDPRQRFDLKGSQYRHPSNIIHETSEEHRGSNKQSMVNFESDIRSKYVQREGNVPHQEIMEKRIVGGGTYNQPATHYINSSDSIHQGKNDVKGTYGKIYQSPSKVVRKEDVTQPEEVRHEDAKRYQEYRPHVPPSRQFTFGTPTYNTNHTTTNSSYQNYNKVNLNPPVNNTHVPSSYNTLNHQANYTSPTISPQADRLSSIRIEPSKVNTTQLNLQGYERVETNGIVMYRKKNNQARQLSRQKLNQTHVNTDIKQVKRDSSPKVVRYEVSPRREQDIRRKQFANSTYNQPVTQPYRSSNYNNGFSSPEKRNYQLSAYSSTYSPEDNRNELNYGMGSSNYKPQVEQRVISKVKTYGGKAGDRVEVERYQYKQQKLQAASPTSRALNDSNWMTRPSDLFSDTSMMKKNNTRFGVKTKKKEESDYSVINSKIGSGIYTVRDLNKKMALHRKMIGEEQLREQSGKYLHLSTLVTGMHILLQEELKYLEGKLGELFGTRDVIEYFSCLEELVQKSLRQVNFGFIIITQQQALKLNCGLLPEDYYMIRLKQGPPLLEINEYTRTIWMDRLERLDLARRIVLDKKLYQFVLHRGNDQTLDQIATQFENTEFVIQKVEVELTEQYLECYYEEEPQLTRLYIMCRQNQLAQVETTIQNYHNANPSFDKRSIRLICVATDSLNQLKLKFPAVTFLKEHQKLSYKDLLREVHNKDSSIQLNIRQDLLFLHQKHQEMTPQIERAFPKRFQFSVYNTVAEANKIMARPRDGKWSSYLVLHDSVGGEKVAVENYSRVFMMGRAKTLPSKVVRVLRKEELIELLRK